MTPLRLAAGCLLALGAIVPVLLAQVIRRWRIGKPVRVDLARGLAALPRRYLVNVHNVVARDRYAARMHALAAGGLIAGALLIGCSLLPGLGSAGWLAGLILLAFAAMAAGSIMVAARRLPKPPPRLSAGRFQTLPLLLGGFATGGILTGTAGLTNSIPIGATGAATLFVSGSALLVQTLRGPLRHAIAGAAHLAAHPRPERFTASSTALLPLDLSAKKLGVETPEDFAWNRLSGFDSCIQCGRCEQVCPAFAAGTPLNPKKLIQDLVSCAAGDTGSVYAGSPHPGLAHRTGVTGPHLPIVGANALVAPETLWSCTTCRACVEECPMMIEHVDAVIDLRRFQVLEHGAIPQKAATALAGLRYADEPGARPLAARTDFAAGLEMPIAKPGEPVDILLWLGEGAYDPRYGRTLRALIKLFHRAKVDFAVLGSQERDSGDLARRLGEEAIFQTLARANIETLRDYRFNSIVTPDPHAYHALKNEYPAFNGTFTVQHHTEFLDTLLTSGRLAPQSPIAQKIAYHDPCYLARYNAVIEAPRNILRSAGAQLLEMPRAGKRTLCCGGGGGAPLTDIQGERRVGDIRMDQARDTGASILAVACPGCTAMLEAVPAPRPEVRDIAELLWDSLGPAAAGKAA